MSKDAQAGDKTTMSPAVARLWALVTIWCIFTGPSIIVPAKPPALLIALLILFDSAPIRMMALIDLSLFIFWPRSLKSEFLEEPPRMRTLGSLKASAAAMVVSG